MAGKNFWTYRFCCLCNVYIYYEWKSMLNVAFFGRYKILYEYVWVRVKASALKPVRFISCIPVYKLICIIIDSIQRTTLEHVYSRVFRIIVNWHSRVTNSRNEPLIFVVSFSMTFILVRYEEFFFLKNAFRLYWQWETFTIFKQKTVCHCFVWARAHHIIRKYERKKRSLQPQIVESVDHMHPIQKIEAVLDASTSLA